MPSTGHRHTKCMCDNSSSRKLSQHNIINNGNKIDKLYYEQYLPLRERKLLDKLIRTRAVYDDIRNRIFSKSSTDMEGDNDKNNLNKIQDLVNFVDRGELQPFNVLGNLDSNDCGCDNCKRNTDLSERAGVHVVHIQPSHEKFNEPTTHFQKPLKEKRVRYRSVRSDPCICAYKFKNSLNVIHPSRENMENKSPIKQKPEAYKKGIGLTKVEPKAAKNNECGCINKTRSLEKVQNATNKIRESIRSSITAIENVFHIKKDSIALYRDKLNKKQEMKAWTCNLDSCVPDECIPQECYEKIKKKRQYQPSRRKEYRKRIPSLESRKQTVVFKSSSENMEDVNKTKSPKPKRVLSNKTNSTASIRNFPTRRYTFRTKSRCKPKTSQCDKKSCVDSQECVRRLLRRSHAEHQLDLGTLQLSKPPKGSQISQPPPKDPVVQNVSPEIKPAKRKDVKCDCDIKKVPAIQTPKTKSDTKPPFNRVESIVQPNKPTFLAFNKLPYECDPSYCIPGSCDPFICKEKFYTHKRAKMTSVSATKSPPNSYRARIPKHRKPPSKTPKIEVPYAAKSKSSPNAPTRQIVRIGSSFRFDIEFYKNLPEQSESTKRNGINITQPKHTKAKTSISDTKTHYDDSQKRFRHGNKYPDKSILEPFLKKCFCNFKSYNYGKQKMNSTKSSMTTAVVNYVMPPNNYPNLLPYECEPNFCTPGLCDPKVCAERIKKRNLATKEFGTMSSQPNRSTSTVTTGLTSKSAATYPGRNTKQDKNQGTNSSKSSWGSNTDQQPIIESKSSPSALKRGKKSAVNIGSTFSFNIEFYKSRNTLEDTDCYTPPKSRESKMEKVNKTKKIKEKKTNAKEKQVMASKNKPRMSTRRIGKRKKQHDEMSQMNKNVDSKVTATEPLLKRCFCTLKLKKNEKKVEKKAEAKKKMMQKKVNTSSSDRYPNATEMKQIHTQTKNIKLPPLASMKTDLLPYECEPNFCIPGKCNPRVCEERIKTRNLLKRCFCTLKFQNSDQGTEKLKVKKPVQQKTVGTETTKQKQKYGHALLSYECEPGICVPGSCDPSQCLKLINKRNMHDAMLQTKNLNKKKAAFSATAKNKCKESQSGLNETHNKKGQSSRKKKKAKDFSTSPSKLAKVQKKEPIYQEEYASPSTDRSNSSRQSVKIGSQMSFEIEFYRGINAPKRNKTSKPVSQTYVKSSKEKKKKVKDKDKSSYPQGFRISKDTGVHARELTSRNAQAGDLSRTADKCSESKLDRCFCTLKLQKKGRFQNHVFMCTQELDNKWPFMQDSRDTLNARECRASHCLHNLDSLNQNLDNHLSLRCL